MRCLFAENFRMPKGYDVVGVSEEALLDVAAHMRKADADEVFASGGLSPLESLQQSVDMSDPAHVITYHGRPLAIGGVVLVNDTTACPWQLCTADSVRHGNGILRLGRQGVDHWLTRRPFLFNMADARNTESLVWLRWLGFTFGEPVIHGPQQLPFVPFWIIHAPGCA
jgi:hypothetical protein